MESSNKRPTKADLEYLEKILQRAKSLMPISKEWEFYEEKNGVQIHLRKDNITKNTIVRGEGTIPANCDELRVFIYEDEKASLQYDRSKASGGIIEKIDSGKYYIYYSKTKPPGFMISPRDALIISSWVKGDDGTIIIYGASTTDPRMPVNKGLVRGHIHIWAWFLKPIDKDKTHAVYMLQSDAKGMLPKSIVNEFIKDQGLCIALIRNIYEKKQKQKNFAGNL